MALKTLPVSVVEAMKRRLADLRAADSILDLVVGAPRFGASTPTQVTLRLADGYELVGVANHRYCPTVEDGAVDWARVRRLKVMAIERTGTND